jgi:hypothetical protein
VDSLGLTWTHLDSLGFTRTHLDSLGCTWTHLDSLGFTWTHLDSLGLTWTHLDSLGLIGIKEITEILGIMEIIGNIVRKGKGNIWSRKGKGKSRRSQKRKGKGRDPRFGRNLTRPNTARTHVCTPGTTRNDFPVGLPPPNLRFNETLARGNGCQTPRKCQILMRHPRGASHKAYIAPWCASDAKGHATINKLYIAEPRPRTS